MNPILFVLVFQIFYILQYKYVMFYMRHVITIGKKEYGKQLVKLEIICNLNFYSPQTANFDV